MLDKKANLLTDAEFAGPPLKVTTACVRRWVPERKIDSVRIGRLVRIPESERDRLIREGLRPRREVR
jgi:excisionase family DNA binding protein